MHIKYFDIIYLNTFYKVNAMSKKNYTIADYENDKRISGVDHILFKIEKVIDWSRIKKIIDPTDYRHTNTTGPDGFSPMLMFRVFLVQAIYNLSDRGTENSLKGDLFVIKFCGLSTSDSVPDHTTMCRWRNRMIEFDVFVSALNDFHDQLEEKGLTLKEGAIVDATIIDSKARPRKKVIIDINSSSGEQSDSPDGSSILQVHEETSKCPDSRWITMGKKSRYGFKSVAGVCKYGLFRKVITTTANIADVSLFPEIISALNLTKGTEVFADRGNASDFNRGFLWRNGLVDKIMIKRNRDEPIDEEIVEWNKCISKIRFVVERSFGGIKSRFDMYRSKYMGLTKTHNSFVLRAFAYNLIRCTKLL